MTPTRRSVQHRSSLARAALLTLGVPFVGCGPLAEVELDGRYEVPLPLTAYCQAQVEGHGLLDVEEDYLPHVVTCENGGAPFESLKAQAVAARTFLYYKLGLSGSIRDGQSDQVYSCGAEPGELQRRAVRETAGQFLSYRGGVICAFFVAGARQTPPSCRGGTSDSTNTERYVTYNWGLEGSGIHQSTLGWVSSTNNANRGCLSQWGSRCLADAGRNHVDILHFYYGMDAQLQTASGSCVAPPAPVNQVPHGYLDGVDGEAIRGWAQDPDAPTRAIAVHLYVDGPAGDAAAIGLALTADVERDDLCAAIGSCGHGFARETPRALCDGEDHPVYAYGIDSEGGASAVLGNSPRTLRCDPPTPPRTPDDGAIRWVVDPASLAAWRLSPLDDLAHVDDAVLAAYRQGPALPPAPRTVRADDGSPEVWVLDSGVRRHVPDGQAFAAWRLVWDHVESMAADALHAIPQGAPWPTQPFLMQGSGPAVYVLDDVEAMGSPEPAPVTADAGAQPDTATDDAAVDAEPAAAADTDAGTVPMSADDDAGESASTLAPRSPTRTDVVELGEGMGCASLTPKGSGWAALLLVLRGRRRRSERRSAAS